MTEMKSKVEIKFKRSNSLSNETEEEEKKQRGLETKEEKKQKDLETRWKFYFHQIVESYFENGTRILEVIKLKEGDYFECYVPTCKTSSFPNIPPPKITWHEEKNESSRSKFNDDVLGVDLCLIYFVCRIETIDGYKRLVVQIHEYGKRCDHCQERYDDSTFDGVDTMMIQVLGMFCNNLLQAGLFNVPNNTFRREFHLKFETEIKFKLIKTNTHEKERERKLEDQEKCFDRIVGSYFKNHTFNGFHGEWDFVKDRLDCFVPSRGEFLCQQFANPGTKKTKKDLRLEKADETATKEVVVENEKGEKKKIIYLKNGCGKKWNSNLCLTKFVCWIEEKNNLVVELREYGQRCDHCEKRYENPTFESYVLEIMIKWLLSMILEGIFDFIDPKVVFDPEEMGYFPRHPKRYYNRRKKEATRETAGGLDDGQGKHNCIMCEACVESKGCGFKRSVKKKKKARNLKKQHQQKQQKRQQNQRQQQQKQQQQQQQKQRKQKQQQQQNQQQQQQKQQQQQQQ